MSDSELPLGQPEGPELEFQSAEVLDDLHGLSRSIVSMLNSTGGVVWVGIEERDGRAVGARAVHEPGRSVRRIQDHLADAVEPAPTREVSIARVALRGAGEVLRIDIRPIEDRAPYAVVRGGARRYLVRVGARLRPMSRAEIRAAFVGGMDGESSEARAVERLLEERSTVQESGFSGLLLLLAPVGEISLRVPSRHLAECLRDPARTGNRPSGWSFANPYVEARPAPDGLILGGADTPQTTVEADGRIRFTVPGEHLRWNGPEREIWPTCLCEYPVSVLRLARTLYAEHESSSLQGVLADLSLLGLGGWRLRPHSPDAIRFRLESGTPLGEEDLLPLSPLRFSREEILEVPDRCAYRLLVRVYAGFQYQEDAMPREFQNADRRFLVRE